MLSLANHASVPLTMSWTRIGPRQAIICIDAGHAWSRPPSDVNECRPAASTHRCYSSTPCLWKKYVSKKRRVYNESISRRNLELERIAPRTDRIEELRQRINDISEGKDPRQSRETTEKQSRGKSRPSDNNAFGEESRSAKTRRKSQKQRAKATQEYEFIDEDQFAFEEEVKPKPKPKPKRTPKRQGNKVHPKTKSQSLQPPYSIFISCLPGLEPLLLLEVQYLQNQWGHVSEAKQTTRAIPGGVKLAVPSLGHMYALHLYLGTASHIYLRLNDEKMEGVPPLFTARGFPELKRKVKDLIVSQQWNKLLSIPYNNVDESKLPWELHVHVTTSKSKLMHTKAVEQRVRETIGDVLGIKGLANTNDSSKTDSNSNERMKASKRKNARERPIVRLLVRIERDVVQISLDTSSIPLHMRGYRLNPFKAPLREDLAFALLVAGGIKPSWDLQPLQWALHIDAARSKGRLDSKAPTSFQLFDPFCGSGTIAIEGCSILAGLPPGRFRPPPLRGTKLCDPSLWDEMKSQALSVSSNDGKIVAANDNNNEAISAAKSNAQRAGVEKLIDFNTGSFKVHPLLKPSKQSAVRKRPDFNTVHVVTNPPYGKRLSAPSDSKQNIRQLANALKSSPYNMECTLIGNHPRPLRESRLPLEVAFSTKHGGMAVVAMTGTVNDSAKDKSIN